MDLVKEFLTKMDVSEDDALQALLAAFSPIQASALRQNWMRSSNFGNTAPTTKDIWRKFEEADFRCSNYGSQYRITLDHSDNNPLNHEYSNLVVLCFECNRGRSAKATRDRQHQLRIYRAVIDHWHEHKSFLTNREIQDRAQVEQIGGSTYMVKWLRDRLVGIDS